MPLINVSLFEGTSEEKKRELMTAITEAVEKTGMPLETIRVYLQEMPKENACIGGVVVADRK